MKIEIPLSKFHEWLQCYENMLAYHEEERHPLIDVMKGDNVMEIKVYIDRDN